MNWFKKHKILSVILALIVIGVVASAAGGGGSKPSTNSSQSDSSAKPAEATPAKTKIALEDFYAKVENGQTKAEVLAFAEGREPTSCSESQSEYIGKTELCSYGGFSDAGIVTITYTNEKVAGKSKTNF